MVLAILEFRDRRQRRAPVRGGDSEKFFLSKSNKKEFDEAVKSLMRGQSNQFLIELNREEKNRNNDREDKNL